MRIESSVTSLSWIPQGAVEGFNRLSFGLRIAHFDPPPPEVLGDLDDLQARDRFRFVNRLKAWIEVQDGHIVDVGQGGGGRVNVTKAGYGPASIAFAPIVLPELRPDPEIGLDSARFVQTAGGQVGFPVPRRVRHEPYIQITGPVTWSTLSLTIHVDGRVEPRLVGPARFPATGSTTTRVGWSPRAASLTTTPGGAGRSAPTPRGELRTRPRS